MLRQGTKLLCGEGSASSWGEGVTGPAGAFGVSAKMRYEMPGGGLSVALDVGSSSRRGQSKVLLLLEAACAPALAASHLRSLLGSQWGCPPGAAVSSRMRNEEAHLDPRLL